MKVDLSIRRLTITAAMVLGLTLVAPEITVAGAYEDALAYVEAVYGPVGETNIAGPGSLEWRIIDITITAKQLKSSGNDEEALAKIVEAANLVQSSQ